MQMDSILDIIIAEILMVMFKDHGAIRLHYNLKIIVILWKFVVPLWHRFIKHLYLSNLIHPFR